MSHDNGRSGDLESVSVAGRRCLRSNEDMENACLVLLAEEQEKGEFANSALVAVLSDVVRLTREYSDVMNQPVRPLAPLDSELVALIKLWRVIRGRQTSGRTVFVGETYEDSGSFIRAMEKIESHARGLGV